MSEIINSTFTQIDKSAFVVASLFDESDEPDYWLTLTPQERLQALEWLRQVIYGYDASSSRLQRVLEIAQFQTSLILTSKRYSSSDSENNNSKS